MEIVFSFREQKQKKNKKSLAYSKSPNLTFLQFLINVSLTVYRIIILLIKKENLVIGATDKKISLKIYFIVQDIYLAYSNATKISLPDF